MGLDLYSDLALSRRLEMTEAMANRRFVEAHARIDPGSGAEWIAVAGAYAMFDGPNSPATQTFGLGLFELPSTADLDRIEGFFRDRGAPVIYEVSPLAAKALMAMLSDRGYRPVELTSVMFQPLPARVAAVPGVNVRPTRADELDVWAQTAVAGWEMAAEFSRLVQIGAAAENAHTFLAEIDGRPVATGSMTVHDGVVLLAGAATMPEWRKRGAQGALLEARLTAAAGAGCSLAMICAEPGSASQRNAERQGFRIAYTRIKWALA
jgi:GNAT superfamily N-acetyltransferase